MAKLNAQQIQAKFDKLKRERDDARAERDQLRRRVDQLENSPPAKVQTTQATSKVWKLLIMFGGFGLLAGLCLFAYGMDQQNSNLTAGGVVALLLGVCVWLAGRFGKFWFHE